MNDIFAILKNNNIEVPEEAKANIRKEVAENYKTVNEFNQKMETIQDDIKKAEERANTAEKALESLGDIDPAQVNETIKKLQEELKEEKEKYRADIENREYNELIKNAMSAMEFTSESAKKAFIADLNADKLKVKNGELIGFDDFVKAFAKADPQAMVDLKNKPPMFAAKPQPKNQGEPVTKETIDATKNRSERQKLIAENIELYLGKE